MTDDSAADLSVLNSQRHLWSLGDYDEVALRLLPISLGVLDSIALSAGMRLLDVATGNGNAAIEAALRGADVTGIDLTPSQLDKARTRASAAGADIRWQEANAEALPYPDDAFDAVVSVMGMIFAADHERAAREMVRVCRPGGQIATTAWLDDETSWFRNWRESVEDLLPPPPSGGPAPDAWGVPREMQERLNQAGLDAKVEIRSFSWEFPTPEAAFTFYTTHAGPFIAFFDAVRADGREEEAKARLLATIEAKNVATDGTVRLNAPYVLGVAQR